jgi:RNA recognition motif-containing protein
VGYTCRLKDRTLTASFAEAKQQDTPSAAALATVKAVYVGNLPASATEDKLKEVFAAHGTVSPGSNPRSLAIP